MTFRFSYLFTVLLITVSVCGQRVDVIDHSGFKHKYVVGEAVYIEIPADTMRLSYIATIRISGKQNWTLRALEWHYIIGIKAKELGANAIRCINYEEDSTYISFDVRVYFAPRSFLTDNENRRILNEIVVFNQSRFPGDTGDFYLDKRRILFDARRVYRQPANMDTDYLLKTNENDITARKVQFNNYAPAKFFIVPFSKKSISSGWNLNGQPQSVYIAGIAVSFRKNKPIPLDYEVGRFLMDVYR